MHARFLPGVFPPKELLLLAFLAWLGPVAEAQVNYSEAYTFTTIAGTPGTGSADGTGSGARFFNPLSVATDSAGNIYVADSGNGTIRRITPAGVVTTIAGLAGVGEGSVGVGITVDGTNSNARFVYPHGIAVDSSGVLYVTDNEALRKITRSGSNWVVTTLAGQPGVSGTNDGVGTNAQFNIPRGVAVDGATNIYVADSYNHSIRKVTSAGAVSTLAGLSGFSNSGNTNATGANARFNMPTGVAVDAAGQNIYVADSYNFEIRRVTSAGAVSTLAGAGVYGTNDGTGAGAGFASPYGITIDASGVLYVAENDGQIIRTVTTPGGVVTTLAGLSGSYNFGSADGTGGNARFFEPSGIAVDGATNIYVADTENNEIRHITSAGVVNTLAGLAETSASTDGTGADAHFLYPSGLVVDGATNIYITDSFNNTIRKMTPAGVVGTLAGLAQVDQFGTHLAGTNDGAGSNARFTQPEGIDIDAAGNLYVTDTGDNTVRKITPAGVVSTFAGQPRVAGSNNAAGSAAHFYGPEGIALDYSGNIYVADSQNHAIRMITPGAVVSLFAGKPPLSGTNDGNNSQARFKTPFGIAIDNATNLYVTDTGNHSIRKITASGMVTTIAGLPGTFGTNDGSGTNARFYFPQGIAVDAATNLYVADVNNETIRKLTQAGTNWMVSTIGGLAGYQGTTDGAGNAARFYYPSGITVDDSGNLYVSDTYNDTIRQGTFTQFGQPNLVPYLQPGLTGQLRVTLLPPGANGQWRFPWELAWRASGTKAVNLAPGNYPVEFRSLPGWVAIPASLTLSNPAVVTASGISQITNQYFPTVAASDAGGTAGSLTVYLGANPPKAAGWRFLGDTNAFLPSSFTTNLLPGTYLLEFAGPFNNRATPPNASVQVVAGQPTLITVTYPFASVPSASVALPAPVPASQISDVGDYPFAFNGQIQTDIGYGSGVVVQSNVVLTAAHVVFNDNTLSFVNGAYFFLQEQVPSFTPSPVPARGWYVLSGYAAQRTNDLNSGTYSPDISSPASRNLDVAALYFQGAVASGGYGGFLPSDAVPNQWLTGNAEKMLVGYPLDGSLYGIANIVPGAMYQVGPLPFPLTLEPESVTNQQEVYKAAWFLSYAGNSGGPLYVQFNGYYYPAGVYLGTLNGQSVVRAIDSNVTNLITLAATLGDNGTNNNGGGVITIIPNQLVSALNPGYLQVQLAPPAAVQAGAAWLLQPSTNYSTATNFTQVIFSTNAVALQFKPIPGWNLPTNQSVVVAPGIISYPPAFYTVVNPILVVNAQGIGLTGTTNTTYRTESSGSINGPWTGLSTNTIVSNGFNLVAPKPVNPATTFYRAVWLNR